MPNHAACEHPDYIYNDVAHTCSYCEETDTAFFLIFPPDATIAERMTATQIDVFRHGGAHRAEPVSLYKFPPAFAAFVATLEWDEEPALVADELDLPRHLFAR